MHALFVLNEQYVFSLDASTRTDTEEKQEFIMVRVWNSPMISIATIWIGYIGWGVYRNHMGVAHSYCYEVLKKAMFLYTVSDHEADQ